MTAELVGVDRWTIGFVDQAQVTFEIPGRHVRIKVERIRRGRWLGWLDGAYEDGESTGDEQLDAALIRRALRVISLGGRIEDRLDDVAGRVYELEHPEAVLRRGRRNAA
jgi:hypothetical protein